MLLADLVGTERQIVTWALVVLALGSAVVLTFSVRAELRHRRDGVVPSVRLALSAAGAALVLVFLALAVAGALVRDDLDHRAAGDNARFFVESDPACRIWPLTMVDATASGGRIEYVCSWTILGWPQFSGRATP